MDLYDERLTLIEIYICKYVCTKHYVILRLLSALSSSIFLDWRKRDKL